MVTVVLVALLGWLVVSAPLAVATGRMIAARSTHDVDELRRSFAATR